MTIHPVPKPGPKVRKPPKRLQAKGFLKRHTGINPKRKGPPRRGPARDDGYKALVRTLKCCGSDLPHVCGGGKIQASHTGEDKGGSMKSSDYSCTPKCPNLHVEWEQRKGAFLGWSRRRRQDWAAMKVEQTQALLGFREAA